MGTYDGLVPKPEPNDQHIEPQEDTLMKKIWKSKTFWVNALTALAGVAAYFQTDVITDNPQAVGGIAAAIGIINVILRFMTKEPVSV